MKTFTGTLLTAAFFAALIGLVAIDHGWLEATKAFLAALSITAFLVLVVWLIFSSL